MEQQILDEQCNLAAKLSRLRATAESGHFEAPVLITDLIFDNANVLNKPLFYIKKAGSRRKSGHSETHPTQITC